MEILSLNESSNIATEADELCCFIEQNADALRNGKIGKNGRLANRSIELLQIGRNAVYRIPGQNRWYLKMPCNGKTRGIIGEINGFRFIRDNFQNLEFYLHPAAIRSSLEEKYLLSAEVPGKQLNYKLYRACFRPGAKRGKQLENIFYRCGTMLGQFHKNGQGIDLPEVRRLDFILQRRIEKVKSLDKTGEKIARWLEENRSTDDQHTIVHGNCTFRNILVDGNRLSLIDFETCGSGSRYNDLARMCSDIILCRTAIAFPWKRAYVALAAFQKGYSEMFPFDREQLLKFIAYYIFDRYIQVYGIKRKKESISGIPVSRAKLNRLHERLLTGDTEGVFNLSRQS